jgi:cytochrome P450
MTPVDFYSPAVIADPFPLFARLRDDDPAYWSDQLGGWALTRYADVAMGLRDARFSADRIDPFVEHQSSVPGEVAQQLGDMIRLWVVFRDPPEHTRLRRLLNKGFTPRVIAALRGRIEALVDELLAPLQSCSEFDLISAFAPPLPARVIAEILGVPVQDIDRLKRWSDDLAAFILVSRGHPNRYLAAATSLREMSAYFGDLIEQRRPLSGDRVIDELIRAHDAADGLTLAEVIASCVLLLFAGHETTTQFIGNSVYALLHHPEQRARLCRPDADDFFRRGAMEELLRFDGPSLHMGRVLQQEVSLHGRRLRRGDRVFLFISAANRDPAAFMHPDRLDLQRLDAHRHLSFGNGIHICLGAHLARLEGLVAIPALLRTLPRLALGEAPPRWSDSLVIRGMTSLPLRA